MKFTLSWSLIVFAVASPVFADSSEPVEFSANSTNDSRIEVKTSIPKDQATWLFFKITQDGGTGRTDFIFANDGSPLDKNLYLEFGAGAYTIELYEHTNPDRNGTYEFVTRVHATNEDTRDLQYLFPSSEVQSDSPEIIALAHQLTDGISGDLDKAGAIHDWVAQHVVYDVDAYNAFLAGTPLPYQSALSTLQSDKAVCEGYAALVAALNRAAGIPTKVVTGIGKTLGGSGDHAWNEFLVGGNWLIEDATWDAGYIDMTSQKYVESFKRKYFNPNASVFAEDHTKIQETAN